MKTNQVTWSTLELTGLLEDEESHVHFIRIVKHLALHPYHLNNIQRGLNQILRSSLNSYDRELKGFVLAFRNPKLLSNLGEMLHDSPFIHIDVEADFYLFRPTIGSFLKGTVKKKGLDHIIVLVHKIYTVSIPKPDDTEEWAGELVEIGQEVKCCVNQIDSRSKPPFICATLMSDYSQGCRLLESINTVGNVDSAVENVNKTIKIDASVNGISEDDVSEKEKKKHQKKYKKSKRISKSPLSDDTILDECIKSRKAVKRENSIPLDSIAKTETKKRKKHTKKSGEFDSDSENEETVNTENTTSRCIEFEVEHMHKKHIISNTNVSSSNLEDRVSKKCKKNRKASMKMSEDSESESHVVKIKIEKQDPFIDRINNKSQISCNETEIAQNLNKNLEMSKFVKNEGTTIEYDSFEKERKKSPKKRMVTSQLKSVKIKKEDMISDISDISDKERKKKHANVSKDLNSLEIKIKKENITNDINDTSRVIKRGPEKSQCIKYNISTMDSSLDNSDLDRVSKKSKKKKISTILTDSELKCPVKLKTEMV